MIERIKKDKVFKCGSLFSGVGGFDLAAWWMGWDTVFHCEINKFGQRVLKYYWPDAIIHEDITKTDFTGYRHTIDVLTGGFPCQPYSVAGKRKGKGDDRHLWPEMLRAIREIQPTWIVGENVPGLITWSDGLVFREVQSDLETERYEVIPVVLPACSINAPHRRYRIFFIAHSTGNGRKTGYKETGGEEREGEQRRMQQSEGDSSFVTNSQRSSKQGRLQQRQGEREFRGCNSETPSNPITEGLQGSENDRIPGESREERNKQSSRPFCTDWKDFPTQPPLCSRDDGFSTELDGITFSKWRNESIKAYGNAVVPQVILQIFKTIQEYEYFY
jgi:DNA (cytosine-5)-methyltransferase 1